MSLESNRRSESPLAPEVAEALATLRRKHTNGLTHAGRCSQCAALALITRELERVARVEAAARWVVDRHDGSIWAGVAGENTYVERLRAALAPQEEER